MSNTPGRYCQRHVQVAADFKDPIKRCQLPCRGGHGRGKGCLDTLFSSPHLQPLLDRIQELLGPGGAADSKSLMKRF